MKKLYGKIALLLMSLIVFLPAEVQATYPGYNGRITFHTSVVGNTEIYSMNADGSDVVNITNNAASDKDAAWSPDGSKIAFASDRDGDQEIYVMDASGDNIQQLTFNSDINDTHQRWSPDGSKIAFISMRDGNWEIYVMNADGSNQVRLTDNPASDQLPSWSPDGKELLFVSSRDTGKTQIYKMKSDGSDVVRLTFTTSSDGSPHWHPSGDKIIFNSFRDSNYEIYEMNADGSNQTKITNSSLDEIYPMYSPDGTKIVFRSEVTVGGDYGIAIMDSDGGNKEFLTLGPTDSYPHWQPIPNKKPVVVSDESTTSFNTSKLINVLTNDTDEEALDAQYLTIKSQPTKGSAKIKDGKIEYTPNNNYVGSDELTYQICDSFLLDQKCATGVLSITVQAGPKPPTPKIEKVGSVELNNSNKVYYTSNKPTFSGIAEPFATVKIEIHSDPIILTTQADANGNWSVTPDQDIPNGEHTVKITTIKDGVESDPVTFTLGINVGLAETGNPLWPLTLIGFVGALGVVSGRYLKRRSIK